MLIMAAMLWSKLSSERCSKMHVTSSEMSSKMHMMSCKKCSETSSETSCEMSSEKSSKKSSKKGSKKSSKKGSTLTLRRIQSISREDGSVLKISNS